MLVCFSLRLKMFLDWCYCTTGGSINEEDSRFKSFQVLHFPSIAENQTEAINLHTVCVFVCVCLSRRLLLDTLGWTQASPMVLIRNNQ